MTPSIIGAFMTPLICAVMLWGVWDGYQKGKLTAIQAVFVGSPIWVPCGALTLIFLLLAVT